MIFDTPTAVIQFSIILLHFVVALRILYRRHKESLNPANHYLAFYFLLVSLYSLTHFSIFQAKNPYLVAFLLTSISPLWYLLGPLVYFYVRNTMLGTGNIQKHDLWHLVPFFLQIIHIVPYWLSSFEYKFMLAQQVVVEPGTLFSIPWGWLYPSYFNFFGRPLLGLLYALAALFFLYRNTNLFTQRSVYQNDLFRWFILFLVGISSLYTVNLSVLMDLFTIDGSVKVILFESNSFKFQGIIYIFLGIVPLFFPHILYGNIEKLTVTSREAPDREILKNGTKEEKVEEVKPEQQLPDDRLLALDHQIKQYLTSQKPYLVPDFTLSNMVKVLNIPEYHVQYYLTYFKKQPFSDYLIDLRIEHAKNLLAWGGSNDLRLETIAVACGYTHINTFIEHFKKVTGMLPSEYMNLMNPLPET